MVANLPYGVAATVVLRTIAELPAIARWVVMVQREVGERFAAAPGTDAYGVPSVLAQLACEVRVLRPVSRSVFRPVPNVDSVLLGLRRSGPAAEPEVARARPRRVRAPPQGAGRIAGAGRRAFGPGIRERARAALVELGHPPDERAERLAAVRVPGARPAARLMTLPPAERAPAKINLCLFLGPTRADGRHELVTLFDSVTLVDELAVDRGEPRSAWSARRRGAQPGVRRAGALRAAGWDAPPVQRADRQADPGRRRDGRRLGRRRGACCGWLRVWPRSTRTVLAEIAARSGRRRARPAATRGRASAPARGRCWSRWRRCLRMACSCCPSRSRCRRPTSTGRPTGSASAGRRASWRAVRRAASPSPRCRPAGRQRPAAGRGVAGAGDRRRARRRAEAGADQALVCGSGPTVIGLFRGSTDWRGPSPRRTRCGPRYPGATAAAPVERGVRAPGGERVAVSRNLRAS